LLEKGEAVFISSPYWPERPVLNELYALLAPPQRRSAAWANGLDVRELERTFPVYALQRVPLIRGQPFYIYRLARREPAGAQAPGSLLSLRFEGEDMTVGRVSGGKLFPQPLGSPGRGGGQVLWLDGKEGDVLELVFSVPRDLLADLVLDYTRSSDFGRFTVSIDGLETGTAFEGWSTTLGLDHASIATARLQAGNHVLQVRLVGIRPEAGTRYGFGLDCLRIDERRN